MVVASGSPMQLENMRTLACITRQLISHIYLARAEEQVHNLCLCLSQTNTSPPEDTSQL